MGLSNWVPVAINKWLKQLDDRQNVYYYNMQTQESVGCRLLVRGPEREVVPVRHCVLR